MQKQSPERPLKKEQVLRISKRSIRRSPRAVNRTDSDKGTVEEREKLHLRSGEMCPAGLQHCKKQSAAEGHSGGHAAPTFPIRNDKSNQSDKSGFKFRINRREVRVVCQSTKAISRRSSLRTCEQRDRGKAPRWRPARWRRTRPRLPLRELL